jgi:hypothetical protein
MCEKRRGIQEGRIDMLSCRIKCIRGNSLLHLLGLEALHCILLLVFDFE